MSVKDQLAEAKDLISQKRFDEARYVLSNIDHPTAKQWLAKLNKVAPPSNIDLPADDEWARTARKNRNKARPTPAPASKAKNGANASLSPTMIGIVVVVLLAVGGLLAFVMLNPDTSPFAPADETGCGAQDWYNTFSGTIGDVAFFDPWSVVDYDATAETLGMVTIPGAISTRRSFLDQRIAAVQASPAPDCIAGVDDSLIAALEAQRNVVDRLEADSPNTAFYYIGVSIDSAKQAFNEMLSVGVNFRGSDSNAITQLTDPTCPALDWAFKVMYTENQFLVLVLNIDDVIAATSTRSAVINYSTDLSQQEVQLKYNIATPACMQDAKTHLLAAMESYRGVLDSIRGDPINSLTTAIPYHAERIESEMSAFYQELSNHGVSPQQFAAGNTTGIRFGG